MKAPWLANLPAGVDAKLVSQVLDCCRVASEQQQTKFTGFIDPFHREFIRPLVGNFFGIRFFEDGGYPGAEKQRLAIYPDFYRATDIELPIAALAVQLSDPTRVLSHRDYLGAVLGLGVERNLWGDIIVFAGGAHILAAAEIAEQARSLTAVHKFPAAVTEIPPYCLRADEEPLRVIAGTVASLRLDAIVSAGLGIGRSKSAELVKGGRIKVNWRQILQPGFALKPGDVISIRGTGRLELAAVAGETKKGRIRVRINKFS